eukprot:5505131-Karenia_brevis.AAC.1
MTQPLASMSTDMDLCAFLGLYLSSKFLGFDIVQFLYRFQAFANDIDTRSADKPISDKHLADIRRLSMHFQGIRYNVRLPNYMTNFFVSEIEVHPVSFRISDKRQKYFLRSRGQLQGICVRIY